MDIIKVGQEEDATLDPDGVPWETEPHTMEDEEGTDADPVEDKDGEAPDFDSQDWVDP